jgi:hypothetical protein
MLCAIKLNALLARPAKSCSIPPLMRAALSPGAELTISTALLHGRAEAREELEAVARAQTLLAGGRATLGIAGAPSPAALDALDAAARLADPNGRGGAAILVRADDATTRRRLIADEAARARAGTALALARARSIQRSRNSPIEAVRNGLNA